MFFLIPLAIAAASTISVGTIATGTAVAVSAGAFAAKKIADKVEEENYQAVARAKKAARQTVIKEQQNALKEKENLKADKMKCIQEELAACEMEESDKQLCSSRIETLVCRK